MYPASPRSTLFPYTTLFRSPPRWHDLARERSAIGGLCGALVAAQRELVLLLAADLVADRQVLRRQTHVHRRRAVAEVEPRTAIEAGLHRNVVHVLDPAGNLHVLGVGRDARCRRVDCLQARAAVAVDCHPADLQRQRVGLPPPPPISSGSPAISAAMRAMS